MRINYTTYDVRRNGDTINPRTYPDVMVKSPETGPGAQPYWYACVIGIFHTYILSTHPGVGGGGKCTPWSSYGYVGLGWSLANIAMDSHMHACQKLDGLNHRISSHSPFLTPHRSSEEHILFLPSWRDAHLLCCQ